MFQDVSSQLESIRGYDEKIVAVEKSTQQRMEALEKKLTKKIKKRDKRVCIHIDNNVNINLF